METHLSDEEAMCRICRETHCSIENPFIHPCACIGTVQFVHERCWITAGERCQMCRHNISDPNMDPTRGGELLSLIISSILPILTTMDQNINQVTALQIRNHEMHNKIISTIIQILQTRTTRIVLFVWAMAIVTIGIRVSVVECSAILELVSGK